jgi:hypothetical protein
VPDLPEALFHPQGDAFVPTALCIGPWDPQLLHGGPPSGLLARAVATFGDDADEFDVVRITVDMLRPVPRVPLRVRVEPLRLGREAQWLTASLLGRDDRVLSVAHALRVRRVELDLPDAHTPPRPSPAAPSTVAPFTFPFFPTDIAFHRAIELRLVEGAWPRGPVAAWIRLRVPLVHGQPTPSIARVLTVCDAVNGVSPALVVGQFSFPNADLSVHLRRPLRGEWVGFRARSTPDPAGAGLAQASLYDADGEVGRCLESLVIRAV